MKKEILSEQKYLKPEVKKILKAHGGFWYMPVANEFSEQGIPDFIGCRKTDGKLFGVETKTTNKNPSKWQIRQAKRIMKSNGSYFFIDGNYGLELLEDFLNDLF